MVSKAKSVKSNTISASSKTNSCATMKPVSAQLIKITTVTVITRQKHARCKAVTYTRDALILANRVKLHLITIHMVVTVT